MNFSNPTTASKFSTSFSYLSAHGDSLAIILGVLLVASLVLRGRSGSKKQLPPSPSGGVPILGNLLQLPKTNGWLTMADWAKELGPIYHLNMAGQPVIVLNSRKAALDLLQRRSNIYSDRPRFVMTTELMSQGLVVGFTRFGSLWKRFRKAAHIGINIEASKAYYPIMEREAALLVQEMIKDPNGWDDHFRRVVASSIFTALYGSKPMMSKDDPIVEKINDVMHRLSSAAVPGAFIVDIFPVLKHLPAWSAKWKRDAISWFNKDSAMFTGFMDQVRTDMKSPDPPPSFGAVLVENQEKFGLDNRETAWLAGSMFGAGSDATAGTLRWFMLAATLFPDKIKKAQDEINMVVGRDRLPLFSDRDNLPFVRAFCREVMRWRTVAPIGVPHRLIEDDFYEGYFIPKGSIVMTNIYTINRDPEHYSDPEEFMPERFLNEDETEEIKMEETSNQGHSTFGFGRRACAGMHIANNLLFISVSNLLWSFNISKAKDSDGKTITPSDSDYHDSGLVVRPHLWKVDITPRGKNPGIFAKERFEAGA